jgi:hypothetical protein
MMRRDYDISWLVIVALAIGYKEKRAENAPFRHENPFQ